MTELRKRVSRLTISRRREQSKSRPLIVSLEPGDIIGIRLQGSRQTFRVSIEGVYEYAMTRHLARVEKRARQIAKAEGIKNRSALVRARKELAADLKATI